MHEIDALVDSLQGPPAPTEPPVIPELAPPRRRAPWWAAGVGLALAAALLGGLWLAPDGDSGLRGVAGAEVPVHLQVALDHGGQLGRHQPGSPVPVGDVAWFRVTAAAPVQVWVDGPEGRQVLAGQVAVGAEGDLLRTPRGFVTYRFETPGRYVFASSTDPVGSCVPTRCDRVVVEVR